MSLNTEVKRHGRARLTRIAVYSDLHLEYAPVQLAQVDADVIVLAGDIAPKARGLAFARTTRGCTPGPPTSEAAGR